MTDPADMSDEQIDARLVEIAARCFDHARNGEVDELLAYVAAGVPVGISDGSGNSLLMLAAYHGHAGLVTALAERGADVDQLNTRGQSPLAGAVFKADPDVITALMAAGADPDAGSPSARESAAFFQRPELADLLERN